MLMTVFIETSGLAMFALLYRISWLRKRLYGRNLLLGMSFLQEGDIALYLATRQAQLANLKIRLPYNWSELDFYTRKTF